MLDQLLVRWPLKLLALGIAFFIWLSITGQDRTVRDFTVPLEVEFGDDRMAAGVQPPTAVTLRLEGPRITLRKLDAIDLAVRLDLVESPLGRREVSLRTDQLRGVPPGVAVTMFQPERITVDIARRGEKSVAVTPEWAGKPADGFHLYGWEIEPTEVIISGPQALVAAFDQLPTEAIPIEGLTESLQTQVALLSPDPQLELRDQPPPTLRVHVGPTPERRVVEDVAVTLPSVSGASLRMRPGKVDVTLVGSPAALAAVDAAQIVILASPPGSSADRSARVPVKGVLRVPAELRPFLSIESIRPAQITVSRHDKESM